MPAHVSLSTWLDEDRCARRSAEAGEPLAGSGPYATRVWLGVEFGGRWAPKALASEGLPERAREALRALDAKPGVRVQLVRRPDTHPSRVRVFVGRDDGVTATLAQAELKHLDAIATLDFDWLAGGDPTAPFAPRHAPLHLVCTHGKRDACCAVLGQRVFRAVDAIAPDEVFQTTHTGGHRFAANVVSFPGGFALGRVQPDDAGPLVDAMRRGELYDPAMLRGRTALDAPAQAAEAMLRVALDLRGRDALRVEATVPREDGAFEVTLVGDGARYRMHLARRPLEAAIPKSCDAAPETLSAFVLIERTRLG